MRPALAILACLAMALPVPTAAQGNDDDYTPLNSRIRRDQPFARNPLPPRYTQQQLGDVTRKRSRAMLSQFSRCVYNRSKSDARELLARTDYGFGDFAQINLDYERALKSFGFKDCLTRVANTNGTGVRLSFSPASLRIWLVQEDYFGRFPDTPTWIAPDIAVAARDYPLSEQNGGVRFAMDFADCVVGSDPYGSDFFFRTVGDTPEEKQAIDQLVPVLAPCFPQGQQVQLQTAMLRVWIGEALLHAATRNYPSPAVPAQEAE